jgi:hypothetical protein
MKKLILFLIALTIVAGCGYKASPYYKKTVIEDNNGTV